MMKMNGKIKTYLVTYCIKTKNDSESCQPKGAEIQKAKSQRTVKKQF